MSRSRGIPSYRLHRSSGQAITTLTDDFGRRRDVLLGAHNTKASKEEYARVLSEWQAKGRKFSPGAQEDITIDELILRYWEWAKRYYGRKEEMSNITASFRPLKFLYSGSLARDLGPLALKSVRELMITGYTHPKFGVQGSLARKTANDRVARIKRLIKYGVEEELVPPSVMHGLQAVSGLRRGKTEARESPPVKPVPEAFVNAVLPHVAEPVRGMIALQSITAMRPGEVVIMRGCDIDVSGRVWVYVPFKHKTENMGFSREVYLGPQAQEIIKPFLKTDMTAYLFSPMDAREQRFQILRASRKTKVQPSQEDRKKSKPRKLPGARYTVESYRRAIKYGCDAADVPDWSPNRLRHSGATRLRKQYGIELARIILGHSTAFTTEIYAEADKAQAIEVMSKIG
jgi:integrase